MNRIFAIAILMTLGGCAASNTESDFLCGAQSGKPCATISEIDGRQASSTRARATSPKTTRSRTVVAESGVRLPEETGRMWISRHMAEGGIIHEESTVRFVVRNARWAPGA